MMVLLFIPGTMLGIPLKKLTKYSDLSLNENQFIKECLNKSTIGSLFAPVGQDKLFIEKIGILSKLLTCPSFSLKNSAWRESREICNGQVIFSNISRLSLLREQNGWDEEGKEWNTTVNLTDQGINNLVLANIELFWNLRLISVENHYLNIDPNTEKFLEAKFLCYRNTLLFSHNLNKPEAEGYDPNTRAVSFFKALGKKLSSRSH